MCTAFAVGKLIYMIIINQEIYNQENGLNNKYCVSVDKIYNKQKYRKIHVRFKKNHLYPHHSEVPRANILGILLSQSLYTFDKFGAYPLCSCVFFFFKYLFVYLFIYGCVGSSFLCEGFL